MEEYDDVAEIILLQAFTPTNLHQFSLNIHSRVHPFAVGTYHRQRILPIKVHAHVGSRSTEREHLAPFTPQRHFPDLKTQFPQGFLIVLSFRTDNVGVFGRQATLFHNVQDAVHTAQKTIHRLRHHPCPVIHRDGWIVPTLIHPHHLQQCILRLFHTNLLQIHLLLLLPFQLIERKCTQVRHTLYEQVQTRSGTDPSLTLSILQRVNERHLHIRLERGIAQQHMPFIHIHMVTIPRAAQQPFQSG